MSTASRELPNILYIGDVAVEASLASRAVLYRLLESYPASKLKIIEGNLWPSQLEKRLPNVSYDTFKVGFERLLRTRLGKIYAGSLHLTSSLKSWRISSKLDGFEPQAVLTDASGFSWRTAASLAAHMNLNLYLIIQDDWLRTTVLPSSMRGWADNQFRKVYQAARARFCVSPYMAQVYKERYGSAATVLYPIRSSRISDFIPLKEDRNSFTRRPVFAYAGSVTNSGYVKSLRDLASILQTFGGSLYIYSTVNNETAKNIGLVAQNIFIRELVPSEILARTLRDEADVLFVPMSFDTWDQVNMRMGFPSKLTDYTATGLPLLIWGPAYCSAVRWARENGGVAEIVDNNDMGNLKSSVAKLIDSPQYRDDLGKRALEVGQRYFSRENVIRHFYKEISICS